jgi:hypothetical protein
MMQENEQINKLLDKQEEMKIDYHALEYEKEKLDIQLCSNLQCKYIGSYNKFEKIDLEMFKKKKVYFFHVNESFYRVDTFNKKFYSVEQPCQSIHIFVTKLKEIHKGDWK